MRDSASPGLSPHDCAVRRLQSACMRWISTRSDRHRLPGRGQTRSAWREPCRRPIALDRHIHIHSIARCRPTNMAQTRSDTVGACDAPTRHCEGIELPDGCHLQTGIPDAGQEQPPIRPDIRSLRRRGIRNPSAYLRVPAQRAIDVGSPGWRRCEWPGCRRRRCVRRRGRDGGRWDRRIRRSVRGRRGCSEHRSADRCRHRPELDRRQIA